MRQFLLQQALLIGQWVNKFHVQNVNEYFLESSVSGASELNWTPPEIQAFERYAEEQLNDMDLESLMIRNQAIAKNIKLRSKSVLQGGNVNLAKTQVFNSAQISPRDNVTSPKASFVNNQIQYLKNMSQMNSGGRQLAVNTQMFTSINQASQQPIMESNSPKNSQIFDASNSS